MRLFRIVLFAALLLCASAAGAESQKVLQPLESFEGRATIAAAINDSGDVVGNGWNAEGQEIPLLWTQKMGYAASAFLGNVAGRAHDINNRGDVLGVLFDPSETHGFLWNRTQGFVDLGRGFYPTKINDAGVIAGMCGDPNPQAPCLWTNGTTTSLDTPFPGVALTMNDRGDVAGYVTDPNDPSGERELPVVWPSGGAMKMLPTRQGAYNGVPYAMNNQGLIVGFSYVPFDRPHLEVLVWNSDGAIEPGPDNIDGVGVAVNNAGLIVGNSPGMDNRTSRGFTWVPGGEVSFLPGGDATQPTDINARGDIAGMVYVGNRFYAAVWRDRPPLRITTPNTPSRWGINTRQRLAWIYEGAAPQFQIDISRDGGNTWSVLDEVPNKPGPSQNFYWTVTGPATSRTRLRVTAVGEESASDINDADIAVSNAFIRVLRPARGAVARFGARQTIFWQHNLGARVPVAIDFSDNGGRSWTTLVERDETRGSDTSSLSWPVNVKPTASARLRIRALDSSGAAGLSEVFTVRAASGVQPAPLFNFVSFGCGGGSGRTAGFGQIDYALKGSVIEATIRFVHGPANSTFPLAYFSGGASCEAFTIGSLTTDATGAGTATVRVDALRHPTYYLVIDGGSTQWASDSLPGQLK